MDYTLFLPGSPTAMKQSNKGRARLPGLMITLQSIRGDQAEFVINSVVIHTVSKGHPAVYDHLGTFFAFKLKEIGPDFVRVSISKDGFIVPAYT
ncbi:MAG: hypothetical protein ACOZAO_03220 [Patescibacteria group bacterium]